MSGKTDDTTSSNVQDPKIFGSLQDRKIKIEAKVKKTVFAGRAFLIAGIAIISIGFGFLWASPSDEKPRHVAECMILGATLLGAWWVLLGQKRLLDERFQDIEFEIDLLRFGATPEESWAEKLLQINRLQLRRYYDLNLGQSSRIFVVGVLSIILGVAVIGVTMYLLWKPSPTGTGGSSDKLVLGLVGASGSLLTNYVAAIFLKMHAAIAASLTDFHAKLVHTHELFLANLLASRIKDPDKRQESFAKLSIAIVGGKEPARLNT